MSPELLSFALVAIAAGAVVGLLAGLLGIGGGLVLVPVLFELMQHLGAQADTAMRGAIATSLACVIATGTRSAMSHARRGSLDWNVVRAWLPSMVVGALVGAEVATRVDASILISTFALMSVALAFNMVFGADAPSTGFTGAPAQWLQRILGGVVGSIASLLGLGVAGFGVPIMTMFGINMRAAVAAAALIGAAVALPASVRFIIAGWEVGDLPPWSLGYVNGLGFLLIAPIALATAPIGASWSHRVSSRAIKRIFAAFLSLNAIRMLLG